MEEELQVSISTGGLDRNKLLIWIRKDASIKELLQRIASEREVSIDECTVLFAGKLLEMKRHGIQTTLSDYNIKDRSELYVIFRLIGGGKEYPSDVEQTDERDMISWEDDPDNPRAKMSCGHAITAESLIDFCRREMDLGKTQFCCPYSDKENGPCKKSWDYNEIRHIATLTADQRQEFENRLSLVRINKTREIQVCPNCSSFCMQADSYVIRCICIICKKGGKPYEFCRFCLKCWNSGSSTNCGNASCKRDDNILQILREASLKNIIGLDGCPSIRTCPNCGMLIEHKEGCKQVTCTECDQKFCFICLRIANPEGAYQCGEYNNPCKIAEIQTTIDRATKKVTYQPTKNASNDSSCTIL